MYNYYKLRGRIAEKYGNLTRFYEEESEKLGIGYASMQKKMKGNAGFSQEDIEIWAKLLDIDHSEIYEYFFN